MQPAFAVRLNAFLRVKPFVSSEETRYYLNGVSIDCAAEDGAVCAATDGHRLGVCFDPDGVSYRSVIVKVARELAAWKPEHKLFGSPWLVGHVNENGLGYVSIVEPGSDADGNDTAEHAIARAEECSLRIGRAFIDGTFPNWRAVVPQNAATGQSQTFNADYVKAFTTKSAKIATIVGSASDAPHLVRVEGGPHFVGVIMPVRAGSVDLPEWLACAKPKMAKAA